MASSAISVSPRVSLHNIVHRPESSVVRIPKRLGENFDVLSLLYKPSDFMKLIPLDRWIFSKDFIKAFQGEFTINTGWTIARSIRHLADEGLGTSPHVDKQIPFNFKGHSDCDIIYEAKVASREARSSQDLQDYREPFAVELDLEKTPPALFVKTSEERITVVLKEKKRSYYEHNNLFESLLPQTDIYHAGDSKQSSDEIDSALEEFLQENNNVQQNRQWCALL